LAKKVLFSSPPLLFFQNLNFLFSLTDRAVNLENLLTVVETEAQTVPLLKKINELETQLRDYEKKCQTYQIELKEREDIIRDLRINGPAATGPMPPAPIPPELIGSMDPSLPPAPPPPMDGLPPPPPPPMDGLPPPPPPPPGMGFAKKAPKREYMKEPPIKLKALQWNKLDANKIKGTVFEEFGENLAGIKLDYGSIDHQFAAKEVAPKGKSKKMRFFFLLLLLF
jgi:hypothetical protein